MKLYTYLGLLLFPAFVTIGNAASDRSPNIVVILTDDQGYADVGFNPAHSKGVSTPNIDRLAKDGVICSNGYVTSAMCLPSRAGLLTGRYQQRSGVHWAEVAKKSSRLLPDYLKEAGYTSAVFGKWHETVDITGDGNPTVRGFDEFYGFNHGGRNYFDLSNTMTQFAPLYRGKEKVVGDQGYLTHRLTDEAVAFIKRQKDQPFLLYLPYSAVHTPLQAHIEDVENHHKNTHDPARKILLAMIDYLDAGVGKVLAALEEKGIYENTLIIFLSDNGGSVIATHAENTPLNGEKLQFLEGGIRVPFVVSWPAKIKGGRIHASPVSALDILPTCLAAAALPVSAEQSFDGINLLPLLTTEATPPLRDLFWWWKTGPFAGGWAVRSGDWKLRHEPSAAEEKFSLFELANDPGEKNDLAQKHPEQVSQLKERFQRWSAAIEADATKI